MVDTNPSKSAPLGGAHRTLTIRDPYSPSVYRFFIQRPNIAGQICLHRYAAVRGLFRLLETKTHSIQPNVRPTGLVPFLQGNEMAVFATLDNAPPGLYHRAECLTHVGDSQAVRSLTQCGEPMRFAMAAPIDLRNDFDSVSLRRLAKRTRDATQSRRLLALAEVYEWWQQDGCVADRRRRSADHSRLGAALQRHADRTGWIDEEVTGRTLEAQRRSPPRTGGGQVEAGPVPAVDGVVRWRHQGLWRGGSWRRSPSRSTRPRSGAS